MKPINANTERNEQVSLFELLGKLIEAGGSDLHLTTNTPPQLRVDGLLRRLEEYRPLTGEDTKRLIYGVMTDAQKKRFEQQLELDFSISVRGLSRFRVNVFDSRGGHGAVFRVIPFEIKSFEELGLPAAVSELCELPRGLVLVTGPTGSGKTTTLAAMIDKINRDRREHIITVEDPIEYIHSHQGCLVNQREVGINTHNFASALRTALRQDPDVVLIGELRDLETIEQALRISETGQLTFATLHTNSAATTINRVIDVFPANQQAQIRAQLSLVLEGILSQVLLPRSNNQGRVMALEILVPNPAIRNLIREDKVHQIHSMMLTGQDKSRMQTLNQSLIGLVQRNLIALQTAIEYSSNPAELMELIGSANYTDNNGRTRSAPDGRRLTPLAL